MELSQEVAKLKAEEDKIRSKVGLQEAKLLPTEEETPNYAVILEGHADLDFEPTFQPLK